MKYKTIHNFNVGYKDAIKIQTHLAKKIILKSTKRPIKVVGACDISYPKSGNKAFAAICVFSYPNLRLLETKIHTGISKFPYIPGLLSFRELPILLKCFSKLKCKPDLILCDGQGIAHPRKMGIATHLGILLNIPTIGCAKSHLYGDYKMPPKSKRSFTYIYGKDKQPIGVCLRTREDIKPVFVSPGHKIDIKSSIKVVLNLTKEFRIPEPLRYAHHVTQERRISIIN